MAYYEKEVQENEAKLHEMTQQPEKYDEYDVKRFRQVLDESYMMVPDSKTRCQQALDDLKLFVQQLHDNEQDKQSEWYPTALDILKQYGIHQTSTEQEKEDAVATTNVDDLVDGEAF